MFRRSLGRLLPATISLILSISPAVRAEGAADAPADSTARLTIPDSTGARYVVPVVEVIGSYERSLAPQSAASQGLVTPKELALRPLLRAGDVLESVPGLIISQHSGEGKANQYYLRGFNLDHGTDFATTIAGVPVNLPTHGHGQGYTDLNFFIPELVSVVQYRKGTYSAEDGDFSSAGSARISYRNELPAPILSITPGQEGYRRVFAAGSPRLSGGSVLAAIELLRNDGPWVHPDEYRKLNGLLRYSRGTAGRGISVSAMGYDGRWNSTDQVPERVVTSGEISRFGAVDPTDGGTTHRYSLSAEFQDAAPRSLVKASAYVFTYRLDLFSNFTYFLDDALRGDQFEQADERVVAGLQISQATSQQWGTREVQQMIGVHLRRDDISSVGLYHTEARRRLSTTRQDHVVEMSLSPFLQSDVQWTPRLQTILGVRADLYRFGVESNYPAFSGTTSASLASPKASLILGPWGFLNLYANAGYGLHSNDARAARFSSSADSRGAEDDPIPVPGVPSVEHISPLVRTKGAEVGTRLTGAARWSATASLWDLDIASEYVFVGDAGNTEQSRPSRRTGVEFSADLHPVERVRVDADLAYSRARFRDRDSAGNRIPGAVEGVVSAGVSYDDPDAGFGSFRTRYFGPRPLIEDNSVRSVASTQCSVEAGYHFTDHLSGTLEVFNLFDSASSDVDYYYVSRLPGEPAEGVADIHTHPVEPRTIRLAIGARLR